MVEIPQNIQSSPLFTRAKAILLTPDAEWAKIATEADQPKSLFLSYALPLALISPVASFIGGQVFGLGGIFRIGLVASLTIAVLTFVMSLVSLWVVSFAANFVSPKFGGRDDFPAAFRLVTYSWTAAWLGGIFGLVPALAAIGLLASLYSLYLLYKGATPVTGVPQDKAVGFTAVTIVAAIVAMFVVNIVVGLFTAPLLMAGAASSAGSMSIDMGDEGSIETNADGTMTITGPDGEEMTITIDQNEAE